LDLPGGTVVFVETSHALPLVSITVSFRTGGAADPNGKDGLGRMMGRLVRRGCDGLSMMQFERAVDTLGAELSVDVSSASLTFHAQVIRRNLGAFVALLGRMLHKPTFAQEEFDRLLREAVAELEEARDSDRSLAQVAFRRDLFGLDHPYGRGSAGRISTLKSLRVDDVRGRYARDARKSNLVLGFAGDISAEEAEKYALELSQGLPDGGDDAPKVPEPERRSGRRVVFVDKPERTQTQVVIGCLGTHPNDSDHHALLASAAVFGGTFTSRLMREVRSKRGWSYGASARLGVERARHALTIGTFPAATDAAACLALELDLMQKWVEGGITPRELSFIKNYLVRSFAFEIDTPIKRLHQALDIELLGLAPDYYATHTDKTKEVTPELANEAVKRRISTEDLTIVVVGTAAQVAADIEKAVPGLASMDIVPFDRD
jgi:zinc protease